MSGEVSALYEDKTPEDIAEENQDAQEFLYYLEEEGITFDEWIQAEPENIFETIDAYEDEAAEKEIDDLLKEHGMTRSDLNENTRGEIENLINNIISYYQQKGKAMCRSTIRAMASGVSNLYPAASALLIYSLQDHPVKQIFSSPSLVCNAIQNRADFINQYQYIFSLARSNGGSYVMNLVPASGGGYEKPSMELKRQNGMDAYLALHNIYFTAKVWMVTNTNYMRMTFTVFDRYDFTHESYSFNPVNNFGKFINNCAYRAQQLGVIVPYDIVAFPAVPDTYK